ncbi:MAG TPA: ATP-binding protein [Streptosporangiaceae bacterium]|nr:ATP-binding protein [Streptosporangiaceae bacterium]
MPTLRHFVGRNRDLQRLHRHLDAVTADGRGRMLSIRGRRQAGKSRMVTEFTDRTRLPQLFFTASRLAIPAEELARFASEAARSTLPDATAFGDATLSTWSDALRMTASALPDGPAIVVLDEFPWLCESNPSLEGTLQAAWDRLFEPKPVLFILIGSDIAIMEALTTYERPLFGRAKEMVVNPFKLGDTAAMIGVEDPAVAIDAQLITGGYPRLCIEWRDAPDVTTFFGRQLADENSDLIDVGRNVLGAEFPPGLQARQVLTAIGAGERTNKLIGARSGLQAAPLARSLQTLKEAKRVVTADLPLSTRPRNDPRYRVADTYLRFWLRFIEPSLPDIARGRPDLALARVNRAWVDYRGQAVEPLIRESVELLAADDPELPGVSIVGGYWTRTNDVEVDLVGVDRWPGASQVAMVGSIKWRERLAFDRHDLNALAAHRAEVPGAADARLVAVSRSGCTVTDVDRAYDPRDLIAAWH